MKYILNFFNFVKQSIPFDLANATNEAFLKALLKPIQNLNDDFALFIASSRRKANFTGQQVYIEHLLNDAFDITLRRIYIDDGQANILPPFVFKKVEERPIYIYNKSEGEDPFYIYNKSEFFTNADFIVFVPNAILDPALEIKISGIVDKYKQAGKQYEIQGF